MTEWTVSRLDFGNFMKELREHASRPAMTAAAVHIGVSRQAIDRMEDGSLTRLGELHINALLDFYGANDDARVKAEELWREIKTEEKAAKGQGTTRGLWKAYKDQVAPITGKFLRLEGIANHVIAHHPVIFPALLQSADYRRALDRVSEPALSVVDLERRIELTMKRQARLDDPTFRLEAFLSEAVVRNRVGDARVMRNQLEWLARMSERENVAIRLVPFDAGTHPGLTMLTFVWLAFPQGPSGKALPTMVYAEGAIGSVFHEQDEEVSQYRQAIEGLRAVALNEQDTEDLMMKIAKEHAA
ncbi:helix-turn-helix domain-containing protein [Nocardia sp. NBC_01327]|uniref:helix-turn-helix domain-containing protein n=1 Tax=Nocardia sp. NBC_01327 TaxID=2903593 RepID=UPI002E10186D|nr:helix-turn-helix domain-containing protein [Nocardia sp. NBC_01327]